MILHQTFIIRYCLCIEPGRAGVIKVLYAGFLDKADGVFSRSRSSSMNSIEAAGNEVVQFIMFADGYTRKLDQGNVITYRRLVFLLLYYIVIFMVCN